MGDPLQYVWPAVLIRLKASCQVSNIPGHRAVTWLRSRAELAAVIAAGLKQPIHRGEMSSACFSKALRKQD